ncbi:hypothetical protein Q3G72_009247 [Acer saccharum]|nr:hypothetical protein Q3G72_009247 [Acer saccharum]
MFSPRLCRRHGSCREAGHNCRPATLCQVGAGILAIPVVTQESGFLASAVACILCWIFMVVTGFLIAEVNVNTMCELGSGGVSLVSMAKKTLGTVGVQIACWSYIFIHYALLVAYVARSSDILANFLGIPLWECATLFSLVLGGLCYFGSQRITGAVNGALVVGIIISFTALVPIIELFSFLAIATSYIGFVLGLFDFHADWEGDLDPLLIFLPVELC